MTSWFSLAHVGSLGAVALLVGACAGDDGGTVEPPKECAVCSPGARVCVGTASVLCADDGRSATAEPCLAGQVCDPASGACKASNCPSPGARECAGDQLSVCKGADMVAEACPADTACVSGACVAAACTDGDTACGFGVVLSCAGGTWAVSSTCVAGERCATSAGSASCATQKCAPGTPICVDGDGNGTFETSTFCALDGSGPDSGAATDCSALGGLCDKGLCTCVGTGGDADAVAGVGDAVAGSDAGSSGGDVEEDAGAPDVNVPKPDVPQLQKPDKAQATLNGEQVDFDSLGVANWIASAGDDGPSEFGILQIKLAAGTRTMEIQVAPTTIGWTGSINSDAGGDIVGFIGYNDSTVPGADFTHGAGTYPKGSFPGSWDITIEENGGFGGRVAGTFFGTLSHVSGGGNLEVLEGTFDVHHTN